MAKKAVLAPERPHEHVIAALSYNYIERLFLEKGHTVDQPKEDYGYDMMVTTFDKDSHPEGGDIRIQLKAKSKLTFSKDKSYISFQIEGKHHTYWMKELMPVLLIIYDAVKRKAYWLYIQHYFGLPETRQPKKNAKSIRVRVPTRNKFTKHTVNYIQRIKAGILETEVDHHG